MGGLLEDEFFTSGKVDKEKSLQCVGTHHVFFFCFFFVGFTKGNKFCDLLFASLEALPKCGLLLKERICSLRSTFFPLRVTPVEQGSKTANGRAFPEAVLIYFRLSMLTNDVVSFEQLAVEFHISS